MMLLVEVVGMIVVMVVVEKKTNLHKEKACTLLMTGRCDEEQQSK